ncbi:MAG: 30S ribosomal protein S8 [Candidatus Shapirobacteria bacterium]|nr:30S ribosomal protein S8 [Candidatus Shapirobacteria bacterium]
MSQDTVANLLSSLKNAYAVGKPEIRIPFLGFNLALVKILVSEGYVASVNRVLVKKGVEEIVIKLNNPKIQGEIIRNIKRISKPSIRQYVSVEELPHHNRRLGIVIISTPEGLMTTREAVKKNLGGELICRVW